MNTLTVIVVIGLVVSAGALLSGIVSMAHGGDFDRRHSHQFMFARVGLQGITLLLMLVLLLGAAR